MRKGLSYKGEYIHQEGPALLGIGTINEGGGFRSENIRTYGGPYKKENILKPGDVYMALTNMAELNSKFLGSTARVPANFPSIGIATHHVWKVLWKTEDNTMRDFLYWLMRSDSFLTHCSYFGVGTTVYATHGKDVERFEVPKELSFNQITMTRILNLVSEMEGYLQSSLDLLECKIQTLFHSWFIDFNPVKAKAEGKLPYRMDEETAALFPDSFEDSVLGPIPAGWSVVTIHDLASQRRDIVNPDELTTDVPYIGLEHMPRHSIALSEWEGCEGLQSNKFRFNTGDVLFGRLRPYFHKVGPAPVDGVCSTEILVLEPILDVDREFLLSIVSGEHFVNYVSGVSEGVGLPRTKWSHFNLYKLALPPVEIREKFSELMGPLLNIIHESIHQSRTLTESRDALLPRLMSGEL